MVRVIDFFGSTGAESPLWDTDEGGMVELADLPLSADLRHDLTSWSDEMWDLEDEPAWINDHVGRGRRLVELVQAELGDRWLVRWCHGLDPAAEAPTQIEPRPPYVLSEATDTYEVRTVPMGLDRVWTAVDHAIVGDGERYWVEGAELVTEAGRRYPGTVSGEQRGPFPRPPRD